MEQVAALVPQGNDLVMESHDDGFTYIRPFNKRQWLKSFGSCNLAGFAECALHLRNSGLKVLYNCKKFIYLVDSVSGFGIHV